MARTWIWMVGVVAALVAGFGIGYAVEPVPEPEVVTETITETVEVTPESCELALDAAHEVMDTFRDLWNDASPVLGASVDAEDINTLNDAMDQFNEAMDVLTPRWQQFASECDPRYDY